MSSHYIYNATRRIYARNLVLGDMILIKNLCDISDIDRDYLVNKVIENQEWDANDNIVFISSFGEESTNWDDFKFVQSVLIFPEVCVSL